MGTFVSSRQVRQNINLMTPWWLSGASIDLDFDNQRYYDSSLGGSASLAPLNSYLSISRASTKYAKTAAGVLTSFGNDTLAITDLGLLIEDARTNIVINSSNLTTSPWAPYQCTNTIGFADPAGGLTATKTVENTVNDQHQPTGVVASNITSGTARPFTNSIYLKQLSGNRGIRLSHSDQSGNGYFFDIDTSWNVTTTVQGSGASNPSYVLEQLANGWYRLDATVTCPSTATNQRIQLFLLNGGSNSYAGDGASGIYMWGPQIEEASFASSYIPTTGASATRAADSISITGTANTLINAATGSIVAQIGNTEGGSFAANVIDSNGTNCLGFNASNNALASITATLATSNTGNRSTTDDKLALGWAASARSLVLNGGTVATDTTSQTPSATQKLGSASGSSNFIYSYIERLTIWNSKLANATLQSLTTL